MEFSFTVQGIMVGIGDRHELSLTQMRVLGILRDREPRMLDLAQHLGLDKSSVSGLIDRAAGRGLVERRRPGGDGRSVVVALTARGRALAGAIEQELTTELEALCSTLDGAAQTLLADLLGRMLGRRSP